MIEPEKIDRALVFLEHWYRIYAELVDSGSHGWKAGATQHNIKSRDEYLNAVEVIKSLRPRSATLRVV